MSRRCWIGSCWNLVWHFAESGWRVPGVPHLSRGCHGPAEVLKTSVNWAVRQLAIDRNLYFGSDGLGLVLQSSIFCRNTGSGKPGTRT